MSAGLEHDGVREAEQWKAAGGELIGALIAHSRSRAGTEAIREHRASGEPRSLSWQALTRSAAALAALLQAEAVGDTTLMVVSPNRIELQIALLGALWAGLRVLPVSPYSTRSELLQLVERADVRILIGTRPARVAVEGWRGLCIPIETLWFGRSFEEVQVEPRAAGSILLQSSGTTGGPKILRRDARAVAAVGHAVTRALGLDERDRMLLTIPLYHSYGIDLGLASAMIAGCRLEIHEQFVATSARAAITDHRVTVWPAVPVMLDAVSRGSRRALRPNSLRYVVSAGSPLPRRVCEQFEELSGCPVGQIYGASEFGSATFNDPGDVDFERASVGRPLAGVEIRIAEITERQGTRWLAAGLEGEVRIAAESMMSGYVDAAEDPDEEGFLRTGDTGWLDEAGRLYLSGRIKLLIDVGAKSVNPLEIEALLAQRTEVSEAIVLALPFSDTAKRLKAVIVPEAGRSVDVDALKEYTRLHLAPHKIPRVFEVRVDVPRSPTGKILRQVLQRAELEG